MLTATVTQISRESYMEARKAWQDAHVQRVPEFAALRGDGRDEASKRAR